jgi:hypothetical protein
MHDRTRKIGYVPPWINKPKLGRNSAMTVCIAALSNNSRSIVLLADKALTYGLETSNPSQGESDINKIVPIGKSGWNALISGSPGIGDHILRQAAVRLSENPNISRSDTMMATCVQEVYQNYRDQFISDSILKPKQLTKKLVVSRGKDLLPLPEKYFDDVSKEVKQFRLDCHMLICGFDHQKKPHIFSIRDPGIPMSHDLEGQASIGIGAQVATIELQDWATTRKEGTEEVLYSLLAAKARSERILMVGLGWDAVIMVLVKGKPKSFKVTQRIKNLIDGVFNASMRSPFLKQKKLPKQWKTRLKNYVKSIERH